jgi:signal transduction histidine kinase
MKVVYLALWLAGAALCVAMWLGAVYGDLLSVGKASAHYGAVLVSMTVGLVVWRARPDSRLGVLMTAAMFTYALGELNVVFPASALAVTVGLATTWISPAILAHLVLAYPTGRLTSWLDRAFVVMAYAYAVAFALPLLLFDDPRAPHDPQVWECPSCARPLTHVAWENVAQTRHIFYVGLLVLVVLFLPLLAFKLVRAIPGARRVVLPLAVVTLVAGARFAVQAYLFVIGSSTGFWTSSIMFWSETIAALAIPLALAAGLLWGRTGRGAAADLIVELQETPSGSVRDALARTLGDPSLELALWLPERGTYVDDRGKPRELPRPGHARAVTVLGPVDAPIAALVHDPVLLERPSLLESAGAAARLALENERLQAELRAQLAELRASRTRIVTAGDEERRRLERDLHDGAQQRLLALGLALQLAQTQLGPGANGARELLAEADSELRAALDELRELARGIHPAVLTEHGLGAALATLAERSPVPVTLVAVPEARLPGPVEAAAYFLVSETLANVAKYAHASNVRVGLTTENTQLIVDVDDNGVGGADPSRGSGLRGLSDRVHALDGTLDLDSPPGHGTHIHAEIPCA